jgi:hypothetical protein
MTDYPDSELTRSIIGAAFEVHNILGAVFLEKVYRNTLVKELKLQGHLQNWSVPKLWNRQSPSQTKNIVKPICALRGLCASVD